MFNHEPTGYDCPFCRLASGGGDSLTTQDDVVLRTDRALAFVASRWWPNNRGHVLVVPTAHHENLYDLPAPDGHAVHDVVREIAIAIRPATPEDRQPYVRRLSAYLGGVRKDPEERP